MKRLRWRVARWLVGPFVQIPEEQGVWIVQRFEGGWHALIRAKTFRLKMSTRLRSFDDLKPIDWDAPSTTGRFVGTVER